MTTQSSVRVPEIIIDNWQGQYLAQSEIKAALTYLACKTGGQIRLRQHEGQPDYTGDRRWWRMNRIRNCVIGYLRPYR
jgi:hypothetical protein